MLQGHSGIWTYGRRTDMEAHLPHKNLAICALYILKDLN